MADPTTTGTRRRPPAVGVSPPGRFEQMSLAERQAGMARIADAGLDHVFFADHVSFRNGAGTDGMIQAAALSHCHPTLEVHLGVYLLALRHPVTVARQLATLCEMAPGRFVFGVGVGGEDRHEIEICGVDPRTRGRRTDECLQIVRALLSGRRLDFTGEFFTLEAAQILPAPEPAIPIVIGGRSEAALNRTARFGDGWLALWQTPATFTAGVEHIRATAAAAGRHDGFSHGLQLWCGLGPDPASARPWVEKRMESFYQLPFERFERYSPYGTPADIADHLRPYVDAGCETINLAMCAESFEAGVEGASEVKRLLMAWRLSPGFGAGPGRALELGE